jgi:hypothetical protein
MNIKTTMAGLCLAAIAVSANADSNFLDFESYATGPITNGYDGWQITSPGWDQSVQSANAISGNQSWRMSNSVASSSFGDHPYTPALSEKAGSLETNGFFEASWLWSGLAGGKAGEGITVSMDNGLGQRGTWMRMSNVGGIDTGWQIDIFDYDGTNFVNTVLASNINAGSVNKLGFDVTFNDGAQNDVFNVYINDALAYTGTGWEDYFIDSSEGVISYDRLLFRAGGAPTVGAVGIMIDDISYSTSAVPEPATMTILGLAAIAAAKKRKRK